MTDSRVEKSFLKKGISLPSSNSPPTQSISRQGRLQGFDLSSALQVKYYSIIQQLTI